MEWYNIFAILIIFFFFFGLTRFYVHEFRTKKRERAQKLESEKLINEILERQKKLNHDPRSELNVAMSNLMKFVNIDDLQNPAIDLPKSQFEIIHGFSTIHGVKAELYDMENIEHSVPLNDITLNAQRISINRAIRTQKGDLVFFVSFSDDNKIVLVSFKSLFKEYPMSFSHDNGNLVFQKSHLGLNKGVPDEYIGLAPNRQLPVDDNLELNEKVLIESPSIDDGFYMPEIEYDEMQEIITISSKYNSNSSGKKIGFKPNQKYTQSEPYTYPVVYMPLSVDIKFPRIGRAENNRGFTEDKFYKILKINFKYDWRVFNDRHVPTKSNCRPFEPDIVMLNESENKNIFIDIEIDEPYEGYSRAPIHELGKDDYRDQFFRNRGWIVIRFAEIQIFTQPKSCAKYIAKVIHAIDPSSTNYLQFENEPDLIPIEQWSSFQSKKWAQEKYREKYLGINSFGVQLRADVKYLYNITQSEEEKRIEDTIGVDVQGVRDEKDDFLSKINPCERDKRISFISEHHQYLIDGNPDTISVSELIDKFFPEFDSDYWANLKAIEKGISKNELLEEWRKNGIENALLGSDLHSQIENYYNELALSTKSTEFNYFLKFIKDYPSMKKYRSEWRIFDEEFMIAGTVDMVFKKNDNSFYLFDWKRSKKVVDQSGNLKLENYAWATGELNHLGDNSYNRYSLQLNIYRRILERRYNLIISSMNLLILHPDYKTYHLIKVPEMNREVDYIFNQALILR